MASKERKEIILDPSTVFGFFTSQLRVVRKKGKTEGGREEDARVSRNLSCGEIANVYGRKTPREKLFEFSDNYVNLKLNVIYFYFILIFFSFSFLFLSK